MKKILMAVAVLGAFAAAPASAQWYIGGGLGSSQAKMGSSAPAAGVTVSGNSSRDTSYKIYGGYQFTPNWGLEMQYADLGRFKYTLSQVGASADGTYRADQWSVAGTGTLPLSNNFYLMGKLGFSSNHVSMSSSCVPAGCMTNGNGRKTDLLAGIGAGYNFNKNWGVRVEYENFGKMSKTSNIGDIKGDNWSVNVQYAF